MGGRLAIFELNQKPPPMKTLIAFCLLALGAGLHAQSRYDNTFDPSIHHFKHRQMQKKEAGYAERIKSECQMIETLWSEMESGYPLKDGHHKVYLVSKKKEDWAQGTAQIQDGRITAFSIDKKNWRSIHEGSSVKDRRGLGKFRFSNGKLVSYTFYFMDWS